MLLSLIYLKTIITVLIILALQLWKRKKKVKNIFFLYVYRNEIL